MYDIEELIKFRVCFLHSSFVLNYIRIELHIYSSVNISVSFQVSICTSSVFLLWEYFMRAVLIYLERLKNKGH